MSVLVRVGRQRAVGVQAVQRLLDLCGGVGHQPARGELVGDDRADHRVAGVGRRDQHDVVDHGVRRDAEDAAQCLGQQPGERGVDPGGRGRRRGVRARDGGGAHRRTPEPNPEAGGSGAPGADADGAALGRAGGAHGAGRGRSAVRPLIAR